MKLNNKEENKKILHYSENKENEHERNSSSCKSQA
jgi:hypothetical protein